MDDSLPQDLVPAWQRFFADKSQIYLDSATGVCEAIFQDGLLFPLQRRRELAMMLAKAAEIKPRVVCEIGTDKGGGLLHWCLLPTVETVIGCEIRGMPFISKFGKYFINLDIVGVEGDSNDRSNLDYIYSRLQVGVGQETIDVLFIDGDKSWFFRDFNNFLPFMSSPGLIFMHDVQDQAPHDAFVQVQRAGFRTEVILDQTEGIEAYQREREGKPCTSSYEGWLRHWNGRSCGVGVIYV